MTSSPAGDAASASNDAAPRVKFDRSFGGTILPRPLDSRLRYVGGKTGIVSVPRRASFSKLLSRLRLIFDSPTPLTIKYQQPDEDFDALVSVVNHDDVLNLRRHKLDSDAFIRLCIFLFSSHDQARRCQRALLHVRPSARHCSTTLNLEDHVDSDYPAFLPCLQEPVCT